jgi:hypothetical protein
VFAMVLFDLQEEIPDKEKNANHGGKSMIKMRGH